MWTDVHQGETDWPRDEGAACRLPEQGDGGGCRHGGHGLRHQHTAQGERKHINALVEREEIKVNGFVNPQLRSTEDYSLRDKVVLVVQ